MNHPWEKYAKGTKPTRPTHIVVAELAKAVSTQAQVTNRIWLGLATADMIALLHFNATPLDCIRLPFGFPEEPASTFWMALGGILFVLTIAFCSAHAQQMRAQQIAFEYLDDNPNAKVFKFIPAQAFYDFLRLPTFNRVGSLPQLVGRKFNSPLTSIPSQGLRFFRACYYILFKLVSLLTYFGLPIAGLLLASWKLRGTLACPWSLLPIVGASIALFAVLHVVYVEIRGAEYALDAIYKAKC